MENLFEAMIAHLKKYEWDERRKLSARMKKRFLKMWLKRNGRYWKSEPIKLKFKNDNGKVTVLTFRNKMTNVVDMIMYLKWDIGRDK